MAEWEPWKILSIIAMKKLTKMVRINIFRMFDLFLDINQMLTTIWGVFIPENQLHFGKHSELCGVFTCPSPIPFPPRLQCNHRESQQPDSPRKTQNGVGAPIIPHFHKIVIDLSSVSPRWSYLQDHIYLPWLWAIEGLSPGAFKENH